MSTIKILYLVQKSGLLTPLHSDTIMGHFCWRLKEHRGAEALDQFCADYSGEPVFTVSDGLGTYDGKLFFPRPEYISPFTPSPARKSEKVKQFLETKSRKGLSYTDAEGLNLFLKGKIAEHEQHLSMLEKDKEMMPRFIPSLRVSVTIDRDQLKALDGGLQNYAPFYPDYSENDVAKKTGQAILVRIYNQKRFNELNAEELLKEVFETGFGKKKSSGYGAFECGDFKEYNGLNEPEKGNAFLSLGHYTPAPGDGLVKGYYSHTVKYGKLGEERANEPNPFKRPVISMKPGSFFQVKQQKPWYGLTTDGLVNGRENIWHFGTPLTLNAVTK